MANHSKGHDSHAEGPHVVPMKILVGVWLALMFFTWLTVSVTTIDLGEFNIFIALAIAVVKSVFVVLYFMHLRWDKPFNAIIFMSAALFVLLFISFALMDTRAYFPSKIPGYAPEIEQTTSTQ